MSTVEQLLIRVQNRFDQPLVGRITHGELTIELAAADLCATCQILRDEPDFRFEQLIDLCAVDYLYYGIGDWMTNQATAEGFSRAVNVEQKSMLNAQINQANTKPTRFAVIYHLLSVTRNQRLRLCVYVDEKNLHIPSVLKIWKSADWYEREAFDLFGIIFDGHPNLKRILTDYDFKGHPFRKDFPLIGEVEMRYDATAGKVVYEPVSIESRTLVPKVIRHITEEIAVEGQQ